MGSIHKTIVLFTMAIMALIACGSPTTPCVPGSSGCPAPKAQTLCDYVKPQIDDKFTCLKNPNMSESGVWGTEAIPNANDLTTAVFAGTNPASLKMEDKPTTWTKVSYSSSFDLSGGIGLKNIASWFPSINLSGSSGWSISVTYNFEDAQIRTLRNIGTALEDTLSSAKTAGNAERIKAVQARINEFCDPTMGTVISTFSYIAKPTVIVTSSNNAALDLDVGWKKLIGANFKVEKKDDGHIEIGAPSAVVIAVQVVKSSQLLQNEPVCKNRVSNLVRDSASAFARAMLDNYQCTFLPVGAAVLNSACPLPDPSVPSTPATALSPRPCELCEINPSFHFSGPACPGNKPSLYAVPMNGLPENVVQAVCTSIKEAVNRDLAAGEQPIEINCKRDAYDWVQNNSGNTWGKVLQPGYAPKQIAFLHALFWDKRKAEEQVRVAQRFQDLIREYADMSASESMWTSAHIQYGNSELWPQFGKANWSEFRTFLVGRWLTHFSDPHVEGYVPGCDGKYIAMTGQWATGDGNCPGPLCLRFGKASRTAAVASDFAAEL